MPNIKGVFTDKDGNVSIIQTDNSKYNLERIDLAKITGNINTGISLKDKQDFDIYIHCYENLTMKNSKRTAVLVCNKGFVPRKEWWIQSEVKISNGIIK